MVFCATVVASVMAAGVVSAEVEDETESARPIVEVPLRGEDPRVDFVPGEVVIETRAGEYDTREVDAQSLRAVKEAAERIETRNPVIEEAGPNYEYVPEFIPKDPLIEQQNWLRTIGAPDAWEYSRGAGVRIGVVDTGWQVNHPDLRKEVLDEYDFVADDQVAEGHNFHGTSVAGVAAADTNNATGVASIGFNARIVMAKACTDVCLTEDVASAIEWLTQKRGVRIINFSFGALYPDGPNGTPNPDPILGDAIIKAQEAGALIVASMGNQNNYVADDYYPACFDGVLGVGAINGAGAKAYFSNTGPCVDLVAPGERVLTTYDENDPIEWEGEIHRPQYAYVSGTSFSAPQVAGTAALIQAKNPGLSADQITSRLQRWATDMGEPGRDDDYGAGLFNAKCSVAPVRNGC